MLIVAPMNLQYSDPALRPQFGFVENECPMDHLEIDVVFHCVFDPEIVEIVDVPFPVVAAVMMSVVVAVDDVVVGLNLDSWQQLSIVGKTPLEALALDIVEVATMEFLAVHQVVYSVLIGVFVQLPFGYYKYLQLSYSSIHPVMN